MSLSIGDVLGPYEVLGTLGAGGMGEVWKARDKRLNRFVAIKTSNALFSDRFAREAKAIASLNHPHICRLYDVGPDYLVLEYVEGSVVKGPLPTDVAVEYATQILSALDAAHRQGVIHRDLKPANILVTKQHGIKLLDFGLARITSDTTDLALTLPGDKLGTPAYMAHEQWEGRPCDTRTDIYCFGRVFYELLTGRRPLQDGHVTVGSPLLDRILQTCLAHDPDDRWQSAFDIQRALSLTQIREPVAKPGRTGQFIAFGALAMLGIGLIVSLLSGRATNVSEVVSFAIYPPEKTVFSTPMNITLNVPQFALAPDGRSIVFAAAADGERSSLWLRQMGELTAKPIEGTDDAEDPFWSPDSHWIGFFADGKLKKVPVSGGAVQVLVAPVRDERGGTWGSTGTILFANSTEPIQRVAAAGGTATSLATLGRGERSHRYPQFLPDGRHYIYLDRSPNGRSALEIGSLDVEGKEHLAQSNNSGVYSASGYLLFVDGNTLFGQPFDQAHGRVSGQPLPITQHVGATTTFKSAISTSSNGVLAYADVVAPNGRLTWFERNGQELEAIGPDGYYTDFRLSPDDRSLAASLLDRKTGQIEIWITDLARGSSDRIVGENAALTATPMWSPDGAQLVYRASSSTVQLFGRSATGGGNERVVLSYEAQRGAGVQSTNLLNTDWSPDGKTILCSARNPSSGSDLWLLPLRDEKAFAKLLASAADEMHGNFSPDGKLFAYTSNESGKFQVYVQTLPLTDRKWQVSTAGGYEPRWRADGREIYYLSLERKLMAVPVSPTPSFGIPKELFQTRVPAGISANRMHYVLNRGGQRFLINTETANQPPSVITIVMNWAAKLIK